MQRPPFRPCRLAGLALLALLLATACSRPAPRGLIMISLDTTRQDHLSVYGYGRRTTPALDRLAARGVVFTNAFAQWNSTVPSHTSMLTGLYPHTHRNRRGSGLDRLTLAEMLAAAGFRTGAFVGGFTMKAEPSSLDRGFEVYSDRFRGTRRDGGEVIDEALAWLGGLAREERYFLFIHFYDAHGPYREGEHLDEYRSAGPGPQLAHVPAYQAHRDAEGRPVRDYHSFLDRYDSQIRYQDDLVARLLEAVDLDRTLVVIVADHGETLAERHRAFNLNHGHNLYVEQVRIPLLFFGAGVSALTVDAPVETVDLVPTLLDLLSVEPPAEAARFQGTNLAPVLRGERGQRDRTTFSTSSTRPLTAAATGYELDLSRLTHSVQSRDWKLVVYPGVEMDYYELFDRRVDPGETRNIAAEQPEVRDRLLRALEEWLALAEGAIPEPRDDEEDLKALRALGYVD